MIKLSFKETGDRKYKTVERFGDKVTKVTLRGTVKCSGIVLPREVVCWLFKHPFKEAESVFLFDGLHVCAEGKAKRSDEDSDNPILAERIAETRAKIKLYKFMFKLCSKLINRYVDIIGSIEDYNMKASDCLLADKIKYDDLYRREVYHLRKLLEET